MIFFSFHFEYGLGCLIVLKLMPLSNFCWKFLKSNIYEVQNHCCCNQADYCATNREGDKVVWASTLSE